MKSFLKVIVSVFVGCCFFGHEIAAQVKDKKISYARCAYYYGPVEQKVPKGQGKLFINEDYKTSITVTGTFNGGFIENAEVYFKATQITYEGYVSFEKAGGKTIALQLLGGRLFKGEEFLGYIEGDPVVLRIDCSFGYATFSPVSGKVYVMDEAYIPKARLSLQFADCADFQYENLDMKPFQLGQENFTTGEIIKSSKPTMMVFENGVKSCISHPVGGMACERPNGDYFKYKGKGFSPEFRLTLSSGSIADTLVTHTFANGNTYVGSVKPALLPRTIGELVSLKHLEWDWSEFCKYAKYGTLTYTDSTGYTGSFSEKGFSNASKLDESAFVDGVLIDGAGNRKIFRYGMDEQEYAKYEQLKESDYLEFDDDGNIQSFQFTFPDLSVLYYEYLRDPAGNEKINNYLICQNGTSVTWRKHKWSNKDYKTMQKFRSGLSVTSKGTEAVTWEYPDGLSISADRDYKSIRGGYGTRILIQEKRADGDYAVSVLDYQWNYYIDKLKKTLDDYTIVYDKESCLEYKDGRVFKGTISLQTSGKSPLQTDERVMIMEITPDSHQPGGIKLMKNGSDGKLLSSCIKVSYDNVTGATLVDGAVYDSNGEVVAIYKSGRQLSDFDFKREKAIIEAKEEKERKEREAAQAQIEAVQKRVKELVEKYGEESLKSAMSGNIESGMHIELVSIAIKMRGWKVNLTRDYGNSQVYEIRGVTLHDYGSSSTLKEGTLATIYVSDDVVTSVKWYGNVHKY